MFDNWYRRLFDRSSKSYGSRQAPTRRQRRLGIEPLEVRATPAILVVTGTGDSIAMDGFITLREALTAANSNAPSGDALAGSVGLDTIKFNIAGAPGTVHTIQPMSALPSITEAVFIDGYSQLGANPNTQSSSDNAFLAIELDGTQDSFHAGLVISANNSTVQGLVINNFDNEGILVLGSNNTIRGNFIGTDPTGKLDRGNGTTGVSLLSSNNTVGGLNLADRNIISGNNLAGVAVLTAGATGNKIRGNFIGVDDTGSAPLGNFGAGVRIFSASGTVVGGAQAGAGNVIAFNEEPGVQVSNLAGTGHVFLGNSIYSNGELGIDLNSDGPTLNDTLDLDSGANGLQNFPVLISARTGAGATDIKGTLNSKPSTAYRIEAFASDTADPSGFGEGKLYLGFINVVTDLLGHAEFTVHSNFILPIGNSVSATATESAAENTSEYSQVRVVTTHFPWHNEGKPFDVTGTGGNADGAVAAEDALAVINYINAFGSGPVPDDALTGEPFGFLDATKDNKVAPDDVLSIINSINSDDADNEGESGEGSGSAAGEFDDLVALLAFDAAEQSARRRAVR